MRGGTLVSCTLDMSKKSIVKVARQPIGPLCRGKMVSSDLGDNQPYLAGFRHRDIFHEV